MSLVASVETIVDNHVLDGDDPRPASDRATAALYELFRVER